MTPHQFPISYSELTLSCLNRANAREFSEPYREHELEWLTDKLLTRKNAALLKLLGS